MNKKIVLGILICTLIFTSIPTSIAIEEEETLDPPAWRTFMFGRINNYEYDADGEYHYYFDAKKIRGRSDDAFTGQTDHFIYVDENFKIYDMIMGFISEHFVIGFFEGPTKPYN